jgi:hypothetical protein
VGDKNGKEKGTHGPVECLKKLKGQQDWRGSDELSKTRRKKHTDRWNRSVEMKTDRWWSGVL